MVKIKLIITVLIILVLVSCQDSIKTQRFPDPFREAFRGKNISLAIAYIDTANVDTVVFDEKGNMILKNSLWSKSRYDYDSLGYLTRYYLLNDASSNFLIRYENKGSSIIQNWHPISSRDWNYKKSDLKPEIERAFKFKKDKEGRITKEHDLFNGDSTLFSYDNLGSLVNKMTYSNGKLKRKIEYKYFKNSSNLNIIKYWDDIQLLRTDYFSSQGLLDSIVYRNYTEKYNYVYY